MTPPDRPESSSEEELEIQGGGRIATLADGVFAIVMTLLVLGIDIPEVPHDQLEVELVSSILEVWLKMAAYVVSFLVLGIYWMGHHTQFHFMRGVDRGALWLNIGFFMMVSLVPFTTRLVGHYGSEGFALLVYGLNLILISAMLLLHWRYVASHGLLDDAVDDELVRDTTRQILVGPAIYAIAIAVSFYDGRIGLLVIFAAPVLYIMPGPIHLHW